MVQAFCESILKFLGILLSTRFHLKSKSSYRNTVLKRIIKLATVNIKNLAISFNLIDCYLFQHQA